MVGSPDRTIGWGLAGRKGKGFGSIGWLLCQIYDIYMLGLMFYWRKMYITDIGMWLDQGTSWWI